MKGEYKLFDVHRSAFMFSFCNGFKIVRGTKIVRSISGCGLYSLRVWALALLNMQVVLIESYLNAYPTSILIVFCVSNKSYEMERLLHSLRFHFTCEF
jgi:hypothetical protein